MGLILYRLLELYIYVIFARIILSYFPLNPGGAMATIFSVVYSLTEPVLGPLRRVMPQLGPFDLSPMIVLFVIRLFLMPLALQLG